MYKYAKNKNLEQRLKQRLKYANYNKALKNKYEINEIEISLLETEIRLNNLQNFIEEKLLPEIEIVTEQFISE